MSAIQLDRCGAIAAEREQKARPRERHGGGDNLLVPNQGAGDEAANQSNTTIMRDC